MYVNKCVKCGREFETKNPKRVICPDCLYPDKKMMINPSTDGNTSAETQTPAQHNEQAPQQPMNGYSTETQPQFYSSYSAGEGRPRPQRQYNNNQGGYGQNRPQGGYRNNNYGNNNYRGGYNQNRQQGGYRRDNQGGGYNREGGYNRDRGGYGQTDHKAVTTETTITTTEDRNRADLTEAVSTTEDLKETKLQNSCW